MYNYESHLKKIKLRIPAGYEISEKNQTLKIRKALDLLLSGKQSEYSKAINNYNGTATLFYPVIKCPYCSGELPVKHTGREPLSRDIIAQWGSGQLDLFEQGNAELVINNKFFAHETIYCPCCKRESKKAEIYYNITISKKRGKIKVSCMFNNIRELMNADWAEKIELEAPYIYYENTVFNLHNGHTHIQITDKDENIICVKDITENPGCIKNGLVYNLILFSQRLRKELKKVFKSSMEFVLQSQDITFEKLVSAVRFIGYPQSFYSAIPFCVGTYRLFPGFKYIAKRLHFAKKVPLLYDRVKLPSNKATRRIIFSEPGLMFYCDEINRLCGAVNNIDYFNKILSMGHIYFILAKINCYPVICEFIAEAFKYENSSVVMNFITNNFSGLTVYAVRYMAMKDAVKKMERNRKKWLRTCVEYTYEEGSEILPSLVRCVHGDEIVDCEIDGYKFEWLVTSADYEIAGQKMNNCLASVYTPVIVIKSKSVYVAAIALDMMKHERITEALMCYNCTVYSNASLCTVIRKWCKRFNIKWNEDEVYAL